VDCRDNPFAASDCQPQPRAGLNLGGSFRACHGGMGRQYTWTWLDLADLDIGNSSDRAIQRLRPS
jgi:hypothetical protein